MATWYRVRKWGYPDKITEAEVTSATEKFVTIGGRRNAKASDYERYFPTLEEAKAHVLNHSRQKVENAKSELAKAEAELTADIERYS